MKLKIFTDGGSRRNPGPAAIGFVIIDQVTNQIVKKMGKRIGIATNNVAEYSAVVEALQFTKNMKVEEINFFLDSQLVVNQLNGIYKIKNANLRNLIIQIRLLEKENGGKIFYQLIPREENTQADGLVNTSLV